jgi:hemolysin activation/secretion protein
VARLAAPVIGPAWRLGLEVGGGTTWGDAPLQRQWFVGGASTLRGYPASTASGTSFARSRIELARTWDFGTTSIFGDVGWAGARNAFDWDDVLYGAGIGGSVLDGLIRLDLSHGLRGPARQFRLDLYLDALL